jgi:hypothetical protein
VKNFKQTEAKLSSGFHGSLLKLMLDPLDNEDAGISVFQRSLEIIPVFKKILP